MQTITTLAQGQHEAKGSKFLSFLMPFGDERDKELALRKAHTKAVHFVKASRHLNEFFHIVESSSDDKEPKGSSGVPSLNVLKGENLINVSVIIVRYFGGTLLGVGGLVRAYSNAVQSAIEVAKAQNLLKPFKLERSIELEVPYSMLNICEYEAQKRACECDKRAFLDTSIRVRITGAVENVEEIVPILEAKCGQLLKVF